MLNDMLKAILEDNAHAFSKALDEALAEKVSVVVSELVEEELVELSKKTLGSYVKKASDNKGMQDRAWGRNRDRDAIDKSYRREGGISKAVDKLTKEEVDLNEAATFHDVFTAHGYLGSSGNYTRQGGVKAHISVAGASTHDDHDGKKKHATPSRLNSYLNRLHDTDVSLKKPKSVNEEIEELDENRGLYQKIKVGDKITYKGYPNPHTPATVTHKDKFGSLHVSHEDKSKGEIYTTDITSHNGAATKKSVER